MENNRATYLKTYFLVMGGVNLFLTWANLVVFWLCVFPVLWKITVFESFAHGIANAALELFG